MTSRGKTSAAEKSAIKPQGKRKVPPSKKKGGPDPTDIHVGSRVRLRRMVIGMSQDALGRKLGLTFQQIQKYEKGANRIGAGRLKQLSEILEVPVQFFFDDLDGAASVDGFAEDGAGDDPFMSLLHSQEGVQLCRYYSEIDDPKVRKRVLELVRSISEAESAGA